VTGALPGPWLRAIAAAAAAGCVLAVLSGALGLDAAHRVLAAVALPPLAAAVVTAWIAYRRLLPFALLAFVGFLAAALVTSPTAHLLLAAGSFAATIAFLVGCLGSRASVRASWRDYLTLTKPRVMSLLLLTGAAGMFVGAGGVPEPARLAAMVAGLALACGGASALNHLLDADVDRRMRRTGSRPVADERLAPAQALEFGLALSAFSFVLLASLVNVLAAFLALAGNLFYVFVYTRWLKRTTPQNIVIGGAAGALPPLVGFAAASGRLTPLALVLFLIVFLWTPPHFWALALLLKRDYEAARIPMLPVVRGEAETARQILAYTVLLVGASLVPFAWRSVGLAYVAAALVLGGIFLALAWRLRAETSPKRAAALFHYSLLYLALLFVMLAIDPLLT
jgi:protoheme IX farnesyltransferase